MLTIDGNGTAAGSPLLGSGTYTIEDRCAGLATASESRASHSGLRDCAGQSSQFKRVPTERHQLDHVRL